MKIRETDVDTALGSGFPSPNGLPVSKFLLQNIDWGAPNMKIVKLVGWYSGF